MKKRLTALCLAGLMLLAMAACKKESEVEPESSQAPKDPNWPVSVGDVRLDAKADSVVSLSPALTEIIYELGGMDQLTGVSDYCDYPDSVRDLPSCGTSQLPDLDAIEDLRPQVVFTSSPLSQQDTVELQQMGAEVVVLPHAESVNGIEEIYVAAGTILGGMIDGERDAVKTFAPLKQKYHALKDAAQSVQTPISGIYLRMTPLMMATGDTFEGTLLEELGIKNSAAEFTKWEYPQEKAVDLYPDVIFYDQTIDAQYLKDAQVYNTTDAVKNERCYEIDATAFERQSARMFDELETLFRSAYPDVSIDLEETDEPSDDNSDDSSQPDEQKESDDMLSLDDMTKVN